jgi:D-lactate dehydrogenase
MKVSVFDIHEFEREIFDAANAGAHELKYIAARLRPETVEAARGSSVVCCFAHDQVDRGAIVKFREMGIKLIALRSAGFNHVDLEAAKECGVPVVRVPEYSPYAIAEHAVALLLSLNRKIHRAFNRVRELNFSLEGLVGFDLHGKTVGVIGAGRIGQAFCKIMKGFGCKLIVYDITRNPELEEFVNYVTLDELFEHADVISLHVPLTPLTHHLINERCFDLMKPNSILINTGRGGLIDTKALLKALKLKKIGGACLDVYEEEEIVFFQDLSSSGIDDDVLARLLTFPNVLITAHQGFLTTEALTNIAETTLKNISAFEAGNDLKFRLV